MFLTNLIILLSTLVLSFFFSGMEIAFLSANRLKIELKTKQGSRAASILSNFKQRTSEVLITILIGNNLALVIFTMQVDFLSGPFLTEYWGIAASDNYLTFTLIQTVIATLIILIFAEYIPKALFRQTSDYIVFPSAYILNIFFYLFRWPVVLVNRISKVILKYLFRVTTEERIVGLEHKDLDLYIQEVIAASENVPVPDLDTDMLNNALAFRETKAREFMIPRTEIVAVPIDSDIAELMEVFIESGHSKIIVYEESLDKVKGFVHSNAMFGMPNDLTDIIQPVLIVPESMAANVLLAEFSENKSTVAIVVDEFGGTAGLITMEDLIEEVFGEIEDEHDQWQTEEIEEDMLYLIAEDGSILLGARHEIDDLNEDENLQLELPDEEYYTTLGGMIMYYAERIPKQNEKIRIGEYFFTIIKATQNRIISVKIQREER